MRLELYLFINQLFIRFAPFFQSEGLAIPKSILKTFSVAGRSAAYKSSGYWVIRV